VPPIPGRLAWFHTTDTYRFRSIVTDGVFVPQHCKVFDEDLTYFFYGRPAFRSVDARKLSYGAKAPVVIVTAPDFVRNGRRLFPFDTGAFGSRYEKWIPPSMRMCEFEFPCELDSSPRHVSAFFGSNDNYLRLKAATPTVPFESELEVESLVHLLTAPTSDAADERRVTIELQVGRITPFDRSTVLAIIVPDELAQASFFVAYMKEQGVGVEVITYPLATLRQGGQYQTVLENQAFEFQRMRGIA
jgi:hypothetical protein